MFRPLKNTACRRRIYLMRHGHVDYFNSDGTAVKEPNLVRLSSIGRQQTQAIQHILSEVDIDTAFCSGLLRTIETAERVLIPRQLTIGELPALKEIQPRDFNLVPASQREEGLVYAFENAHEENATYGQGERFSDFADRVRNQFTSILKNTDWSNLLLVAHDGVNRVILSMIAANCKADIPQLLLNIGGFDQDPCCLNIIDVDVKEGEVQLSRIKSLNLTPDNLLKTNNHLSSMERVFRPYAQKYVTD